MRVSTWLAALGATLAVVAGQAALAQTATATQSPHLNSQQEKMKECNADAKTKGLTGESRKSFMSSCLSAKGVSQEDINKQHEKMKSCNNEANTTGLTGDQRKEFIKRCLSSSG